MERSRQSLALGQLVSAATVVSLQRRISITPGQWRLMALVIYSSLTTTITASERSRQQVLSARSPELVSQDSTVMVVPLLLRNSILLALSQSTRAAISSSWTAVH